MTDPGSGHPAAVVRAPALSPRRLEQRLPAPPRGSGDARVQVVYAAPGTALHDVPVEAHAAGPRLSVAPDSPLAREAFASQTADATRDSEIAV